MLLDGGAKKLSERGTCLCAHGPLTGGTAVILPCIKMRPEAGRRSLSLAPFVVHALRDHRKQQLETRIALGMGRMPDDALLFADLDGEPMCPDTVSRDWANLVRARKLPKISFHGLRHSNVSMLIEGGLDVYSVSRRIGHSSAALTLKTYTHLFRSKEQEAANAIESALKR